MDSVELRLELLKLVYRKDQPPDTAVTVAKELEAYVDPPAPVAALEKRPPGRPKKIGNPFEG